MFMRSFASPTYRKAATYRYINRNLEEMNVD